MKKQTTKSRVLETVMKFGAPGITVNEVREFMLPYKAKRSTIGRALRKLRSELKLVSTRSLSGRRLTVWYPPRAALLSVLKNTSVKATATLKAMAASHPPPTHTPTKIVRQGHSPMPFPKTGSLKMCTPTDKPTLVAAVEKAVKDFTDHEREFSAYDITSEIRVGLVLTPPAYDIDTNEVGTVFVGGKDVAKIEHETIKGIVHDLFQAGEIDGYARLHNGKYWVYSKEDDDFDDAPTNPGPPPVPVAPAGDDTYDGTPTL